MSKFGHYMAGLSVATVLSGAPKEVQAQENVTSDREQNKIENYQELKSELQNDSAMAWQLVNDNKDKVEEENKQNTPPDVVKGHMAKDASFSFGTIYVEGKTPRIDGLAYQESYDSEENYDGYYMPSVLKDDVGQYYQSGTITDVDREWWNDKGEVELGLLAHEAQHMHQHSMVNFDADMSLQQHYKLHCYKEIGAKIAENLQARAMYREAKTEEEREKALKEALPSYRQAIKDGVINPLSDNLVDFEKEMSFIANNTTENWMNYGIADFYDETHVDMTYSDTMWKGGSLETNDVNYQESVSKCMTMGGIDFSKYLEKDIECHNKSVIEADEMLKNGSNRETAIKSMVANEDYVDINVDEGLEGFSKYQKYQLTMQKALVNHLKENRGGRLSSWCIDIKQGDTIDENFDGVCSKIIDAYYNAFESKGILLEDKLNKEPFSFSKASDKEFQEKLREIWTIESPEGENVCLLDGMKEGTTLGWTEFSSNDFRKQDKKSFFGKVVDYTKDKLGIENKKEKQDEGIDGKKIDVSDVLPMRAPNYEALSGDRSEVLYTDKVIDTSTNYLVEERKELVQNTINKSIEFIQNHYNKNANDGGESGGIAQQTEKTTSQQSNTSQQQVLNKIVEAKQNSM